MAAATEAVERLNCQDKGARARRHAKGWSLTKRVGLGLARQR